MRKVLSVILVYFISYVKTLVYEFNNLLLRCVLANQHSKYRLLCMFLMFNLGEGEELG